MNESKQFRLRDLVSRNVQRQKTQATVWGHLKLPKDVSVFKETPNTRVLLDILPYIVTDPAHPDRDDEFGIAVPGSLWYKRPYKLHRGIGVNNSLIVCPTSVGKKCPICEYRLQKVREGADWKDELIRNLRPSLRNIYIVVPLDSKEYEKKPHIWDTSHFLFQEMLNDEIAEDEDRGCFPDLEEGLSLRIRFSEEHLGKNSFAKTARIDFEPRNYKYSSDIVKNLPSLDNLLIIPSYEEVMQTFSEGVPEDDIVTGESVARDVSAPLSHSVLVHRPEAERNQKEVITFEKSGNIIPSFPDPVAEKSQAFPDSRIEESMDEQPSLEVPIRQRTKKESVVTASVTSCPHGHKFGADCDKFDDCGTCPSWEVCMDTYLASKRR